MTLKTNTILILTLLLSLLLILLVLSGAGSLSSPLAILRLVVGVFYVIFIPGYMLQLALFPEQRALDGLDRLALSFGLSFALIPLIMVVLDLLPWGIRLVPIVDALILISLLGGAAVLIRQQRLPEDQRYTLKFAWDARGWWADQSKLQRLLYGGFGTALLLALVSISAIVFTSRPDERFTEFYVLNQSGLAQDYPQQAVSGEPFAVIVGIANQEGIPQEYRVEIRQDGKLLGNMGPFTLGSDERKQQEVWIAPDTPGQDKLGEISAIDLYLFRNDEMIPYRSLALQVDTNPAP